MSVARRIRLSLPVLLALVLPFALAVPAAGRGHHARPRFRPSDGQACPGDPSPGNPSNPLDLPVPPGPDPLRGASFFVPGPAHGSAASAIVSLLGLDPTSFPDEASWASLYNNLTGGPLHLQLLANPALATKVAMLEKIAAQPEAQRFSAFMHGGTPAGILAQVNKVFCNNLTADPGAIPVINTYFAHELVKVCSHAGIAAELPAFRSDIDAMAQGTGDHPAVFLLEIDGLGSSGCFANAGTLPDWEAMLRYEVQKIAALPHTVVYLEAGYSDANSVAYTARALNQIGIGQIRGFFTNDTHMNWTIDEVHWAEQISRMTGGAHYIVNTAQNGDGPLRPSNRVKYGNENLCNPPGRGLGPRLTTTTGFPDADAFMWTHPPGNSSGCGGGPPAGVFWPARAIDLGSRANARLGPQYPSQPY